MPMGAGGTQAQAQAAVAIGVNGVAVKSMQELQASLDTLAPGAKVAISYKSKGKDMLIEGVVK
jgi:S1-C subfamily serine protease